MNRNGHLKQARLFADAANRRWVASKQPDAAGRNIRERWARQGDEYMRLAQYHATMAQIEVEEEPDA